MVVYSSVERVSQASQAKKLTTFKDGNEKVVLGGSRRPRVATQTWNDFPHSGEAFSESTHLLLVFAKRNTGKSKQGKPISRIHKDWKIRIYNLWLIISNFWIEGIVRTHKKFTGLFGQFSQLATPPSLSFGNPEYKFFWGDFWKILISFLANFKVITKVLGIWKTPHAKNLVDKEPKTGLLSNWLGRLV